MTQVLIYVGGILVLMLFGVMLTNKVVNVELKSGTSFNPRPYSCCRGCGHVRRNILLDMERCAGSGCNSRNHNHEDLGEMLMTSYLLPFEIAGDSSRCADGRGNVCQKKNQSLMEKFVSEIFRWLAYSGLSHFLIVSDIVALGIYGIATRRNAILVLMGVELVLNAANINFIAFSRYGGMNFDGQVAAIFVDDSRRVQYRLNTHQHQNGVAACGNPMVPRAKRIALT